MVYVSRSSTVSCTFSDRIFGVAFQKWPWIGLDSYIIPHFKANMSWHAVTQQHLFHKRVLCEDRLNGSKVTNWKNNFWKKCLIPCQNKCNTMKWHQIYWFKINEFKVKVLNIISIKYSKDTIFTIWFKISSHYCTGQNDIQINL